MMGRSCDRQAPDIGGMLMSEREVGGLGWTIHTYDGEFEPMAFGPRNVSVEVNDDDTITIEHEVPSDYYSGSESSARVTVPVRWLTEMIAEVLAYRAKKKGEGC